MAVTCTGKDRVLTASVTGEVDHHRAREMMDELDRQIGAALPKYLTLDLSGVTFMDSSGIAVLLRCYKRMGELGGSVTVRGAPEQACKVLRAARVDRLMTFE